MGRGIIYSHIIVIEDDIVTDLEERNGSLTIISQDVSALIGI